MLMLGRRALLTAVSVLACSDSAFSSAHEFDLSVIEHATGGKLGVFVINTGTDETLSWRADERFPFCSSYKVPLAAFVLWLVDHDRLQLDQMVHYGVADLETYAPITRAHLREGALRIDVLCQAAVSYSDNTAANLLLRETGGAEALTKWMRSQGDTAFQLSHKETLLNLARFGEEHDTTTPRAMAQSYCRFTLGNVLAPSSCERLITWMVGSTTGSKRLRAGLPASWRVGDKTSTWADAWFSTVDVAVAWPPNRAPLIISTLATDTSDTTDAERAMIMIAQSMVKWRR